MSPVRIGALPSQRRDRREALGVEHRIEVPGNADSCDHELARLPDRDRFSVLVDDRDLPAVERPADRDRLAGADPRGRAHDRRLGRAVGVPDLAAGGQPPGERLGARLAAEDQQPHTGQRGLVPHRRQRRDGRDDGDAALAQAMARARIRRARSSVARGRARLRGARPARSPRSWRQNRPTGRQAPGPRERSSTAAPRRRRTRRRSGGSPRRPSARRSIRR